MSPSRREFLYPLGALPLSLLVGCALSRHKNAELIKGLPNVKNFNDRGQYLITEGKTLLINLSFPDAVDQLNGEFPVQIQPESSNGVPLTEAQPLYFYSVGNNQIYRSILSVPLDVIQGKYKAHLKGQEGSGPARWAVNYTVMYGRYKETPITVDKDFSEPSQEIVRRERQDFDTMFKIVRGRTPRRWHEPFVQPVPGPDLDNYGDKRTYNETKRSRHAGLDYRAPMGTPVLAINSGTVVLSGEQWVPGQTICLDHGGGVFSKYLHLSARHVSEGDKVTRGQVIAHSGNSGGQKPPPHLHLDLIVNNVRVDPKDFMWTASLMLQLEAQERTG